MGSVSGRHILEPHSCGGDAQAWFTVRTIRGERLMVCATNEEGAERKALNRWRDWRVSAMIESVKLSREFEVAEHVAGMAAL